MNVVLVLLLNLVALFLILIVLVQRGRGGGLTGALGGMGGQSAFGAKAGDTFTKITMWTAAAWILLCIVAVKRLGPGTDEALGSRDASEQNEAGSAQTPSDAGAVGGLSIPDSPQRGPIDAGAGAGPSPADGAGAKSADTDSGTSPAGAAGDTPAGATGDTPAEGAGS